MIKFAKKGELAPVMESHCEENFSNKVLQFYTLNIGGEKIFVIDDSGVDYKTRITKIKRMYLEQGEN